MILFRYFFSYTLLIPAFLIFFPLKISSQSSGRTVYVGGFYPYKTAKDASAEEKYYKNIEEQIARMGMVPKIAGRASLQENLSSAASEKGSVLIECHYKKDRLGNLILYLQMYDADTGLMIDAHQSTAYLEAGTDLKLDEKELKNSDLDTIRKDTEKAALKMKINISKKENRQSIEENLLNTSLGRDPSLKFPVAAENVAKQAEDVFDILKSTEVVTASRTKESLLNVPASTMVVTEQDFKNRGYTSLDDIFRDLPGFDYIGTMGTDNANLYQRGYRTPFTSRTLLMINGIIENDLWAQVATPSRQYPIANIKRVEVIYGPASAVYGPNAFQGIINIITKDGKENEGRKVSGKTSFMYGSGNTWAVDGGITSQIGDFSLAISARKQEGDDANKNVSNYGYNSRYWVGHPTVWGPMLAKGDAGRPFGKYADPVNDWGTVISGSYKTVKVGVNITNKYEGYGPTYPGDKSQPATMWGKSGISIYAENQVDLSEKVSSYTLLNYRDSRIYGNWAEAVDDWNPGKEMYSYVSYTRWNEISKSLLGNQNIEYKFSSSLKLIGGLKAEFKKLTKSYDVPGYWWGSSFSSVDYLNPDVNKGIDKVTPNGYSIMHSTDPYLLKGPSPKNRMPDENTIGTYDRGAFLLSILEIGKFRFSPGIRYDHNSIYGQSINPRITGIYKFDDRNAFKLLYGEAFNEPSPLNLFGGFSGRTADLKLKPEKVRTGEAIYMHQGKQALNEFSVYYSRYDNVIKENAQNAGKRRIYGFEYKFRWNFSNFISGSAPISFYTYYTFTQAQSSIYYDFQLGEWKEGDTFLGQYEYLFKDQAKNIPRRTKYSNLGDIAPSKINLGFNIPVKNLFIINLRGNYVSRREFYLRNAQRNDYPIENDEESILRRITKEKERTLNPYFIADAGLTFNFGDYGYLTIKIGNLFNKSYNHPGVGQGNSGNYYYERSLLNHPAAWKNVYAEYDSDFLIKA